MSIRRGERVGNAKKTHPLPLRLRSVLVPQEQGGAEGWRGPGWAKKRKQIIALNRGRSSVSGLTGEQGRGLQVDHIHPFRLGGKNKDSNLRVTDMHHNPHVDAMRGAGEKPIQRSPW